MDEIELKRNRLKELASVVIKDEDVELIMNEFELSKKTAEDTLREHNGKVSEALRFLLTA